MTGEPLGAIRVVSGSPDEAELAATLAVLAALPRSGGPGPGPAATAASGNAWWRSRRSLRAELTPGPGRWRTGGA